MAKDRGAGEYKQEKPSGRNSGDDLRPGTLQFDKMIQRGIDDSVSNVRVMHPNRKDDDTQRETTGNARSRRLSNKKSRSSNVQPKELPGVVTMDVFAELANYKSALCVSLYISTHPYGVEVNERVDCIVFKNALQEVVNNLAEKGFDDVAIDKLVRPAYVLLQNERFWHYQSQGLAVFISDGFFRYLRLPVAPHHTLLIKHSFYLSPLMPIVTSKDYFYLLVISKKQASLYKADSFGIEHLPMRELPYGMYDAVRMERKNNHKLWREGDGRTSMANFHGIGAGRPDEKTNIATYLEEVDDTLWKEILHKESVPLLLAGVDYLLPIYRSVTDYKYVWDDELTGNFDEEDIRSLYQQATDKMEPYFKVRLNKAIESYGTQSATSLTSSLAENVIPAAHYGRVANLFIRNGANIWGRFDEISNVLTIHDQKQPEDECLLDRAAIRTLLTGGEVFLLDKEQMPANSPIAALMRY